MKAPRKLDVQADVRANRQVAPGFWRMELKAPKLAPLFAPGQFFQLRIHPSTNAPLLRRPFAPSEIGRNTFAFVYAVVGSGTEAITRLSRGTKVQVLGPLGNGYVLPKRGGRAVLIGGGCGTPSLRALAAALRQRGVEVFSVIGAKTADTLLEEKALARCSSSLTIATDDGSKGFHGHAVAATRNLLDEIGIRPWPMLFACGPHPMLKGLAALAAERKLVCQVSLEERMACGFGACMGCVVAVKAENQDGFVYKRVCHDGPVFRAEDLLWS